MKKVNLGATEVNGLTDGKTQTNLHVSTNFLAAIKFLNINLNSDLHSTNVAAMTAEYTS